MSVTATATSLDFLKALCLEAENKGTSTGNDWLDSSGESLLSHSPVDGQLIGKVQATDAQAYETVIQKAQEAFKIWRTTPAPKRGEIVRQYGEKLRQYKEPLGKLVSYEMGKSLQEGYGEVQEMIDICDFAVGLSRQLYGLTMHSERPNHRMYEQWHPLGIVGIISAFNFPVAVWCWNSAIAWVCGDVCIWKPSEKTPMTAVACQKIFNEVAAENDLPEGISSIINGDYTVGEMMTKDKRIPLISAILELGGNNAIIVSPDADLKMTLIGAVFGAVGTCGQRCTSTRRLIIHKSVYDEVKQNLVNSRRQSIRRRRL